MIYNIHPIFVHFPIAMLFIYSIIKVLPLKRWLPRVAWRDIERVLLVVGVGGAFIALATGESAQHLTHPNRQLVHAHANAGVLATWFYGALLAGEFAAVVNAQHYVYGKGWAWIGQLMQLGERILCNPLFAGVLAVLGFVAITVTGMLGGVIAYGVTADPISPLLLRMFNITL